MKEINEYTIDSVTTADKIYMLSRQVSCTCEIEEYFFIACKELDILVWGDSQAQADEAFGFAFESMYECYALEKDDRLSVEAIETKKRLTELVKEIKQLNK